MKKISTVFFILLLASCRNRVEKETFLFTLLPSSSTHVDFINKLEETEESNIIEYLYFNNGGGVAAGDINNDGLTDLYFTSNQNPDRLYLNKGDLKFEDITERSGTQGTGGWKTGVTMADVNGDGYLDIYVCHVGKYKKYAGKNELFINQHDNTFKEEAHQYGLDFRGFSTQAAFFDYDGDGDLDMYLLNHAVHTSRSYGMSTLRLGRDSLAGDRLFRNDIVDGRIIFHNVTSKSGIFSSQIGYGLGVNICDINNDGFPDIYVSNDFHENDYLYVNNGNATFTERLNDFIGHTSRSSMGNDVGDINNDGLSDIVVLDMLPDNEKIRKRSGGEDDYELAQMKLQYGYNHQLVQNTLQLNLGGGMFSEISFLAGMASTDWSWCPLLCDLDNDGWNDLFITTGIYRRANDLDYVKFVTGGNLAFPAKNNNELSDKALYQKMPLQEFQNFIFKNNRNLTFSNMASEWGMNKKAFSNGATYADLDNDGDLDIIVNNINSPAFIYRNNSNSLSANHYLRVNLIGDGLNTWATGSRVTIYSQGKTQFADQLYTHGFLSSTAGSLHFGLGSTERIDSLVVRWPDRSCSVLKDVPVDKALTITKSNSAKCNYLSKPADNLVRPAEIPGLKFTHREDSWEDYSREKLIPHSLSHEGPALAVADINGDKLQDVFAGGARGQAGMMFIQDAKGSFRELNIPAISQETHMDQVNAAFFDADGDGDNDLYIVRGGNEIPAGNLLLYDILLFNDGKGNFVRGKLPLMAHNGSCVNACDFDGDGDIDLFVGSRSVPGAYGLSPDQFLVENDGHGNFSDVTMNRCPVLRNIGMVTAAVWTDFDADGDKDLIVTGEWMNITVFRNDKGIFTDVTKEAGLSNTSGWWNCIKSVDIDGDGDMDLICGNLGLNSILKASPAGPVEMYLNDFDNNGSVDQVICKYENGISYPFASLDELSGQIKGMESRFPNYADFGGKTIKDIFGSDAVSSSLIRKAVLFESCIFINNGKGQFTLGKLPIEAQFSPVRDIIMSDLNNDKIPDLLLAGNDYEFRPSYGRYDASYGWCLLKDTANVFTTLLPVQSGLKITGDARRLALIEIKGKRYLIAVVNNGELQVFELLK